MQEGPLQIVLNGLLIDVCSVKFGIFADELGSSQRLLSYMLFATTKRNKITDTLFLIQAQCLVYSRPQP